MWRIYYKYKNKKMIRNVQVNNLIYCALCMVIKVILKLIALKNDTYICLFIMLAPKQTDFESFTEFEFRRRRTPDKGEPWFKEIIAWWLLWIRTRVQQQCLLNNKNSLFHMKIVFLLMFKQYLTIYQQLCHA